MMIETIFFLLILLSLNVVGFAYNHTLDKRLSINLPYVLIGFIFLIISGTLFSLLSFDQISNSNVWKISYIFIIFFSIFIVSKNFLHKELIKSFFDIKYLIFIIIFGLILLLRMSNSDILNTEKIMEFMILSSSMSSMSIIPEDLWFHNNPVSYYSYGYFVYSAIPSILDMESSMAYNFILPSVLSITFLSTYGLITRIFEIPKNKIYLFLPFIFIYIYFITPFASILEILSHSTLGTDYIYKLIDIEGITKKENFELFWPNDNWWWFSISRIISYNKPDIFFSDYTINEFPSFSFILGDIHPHILVIPFVILGFSMIFDIFYKKEFTLVSTIWLNLVIIFTILINPWYSVILIWYVICSVFFYRKNINFENKNLLYLAVVLIIELSIFIFLINPNNLLDFPYISNVKIISRFHQLFLYWGFSYIPIFLFILVRILRLGFSKDHIKTFILILSFSLVFPLFLPNFYLNFELFINFLINNIFYSFILSSVIFIIKNEKSLMKHIMILLFSSLVVIYGTEFIYIVDKFNNRMNTVFKFYFINYIILNLVSIYLIYNFLKSLNHFKRYIGSLFLVLVIVPSVWWGVSAIRSRSIDNIGSFGINGLSYLNQSEIEVIDFIKNNIPKESIILEGVGKSYTRSNIISAATGRSTVLAWINHQLQWRSDSELILDLNNKIENFYLNPSHENQMLKEYNVKYILLSTFEKKRYDLNNDSKFKNFNLIFENKEFKIFSLNE